MTNYDVAPWVAATVIALSLWRAFHGPYSDDWWRSTKRWWHSGKHR